MAQDQYNRFIKTLRFSFFTKLIESQLIQSLFEIKNLLEKVKELENYTAIF